MAQTTTMQDDGTPQRNAATPDMGAIMPNSTPAAADRLTPVHHDWDRQSREVAAARRQDVATRLAERQREARRAARIAAWERHETS